MEKGIQYFAFEGIDNCGKTTQLPLVKARLEEMGYTVETIHELNETELGLTVRALLRSADSLSKTAQALMVSAARYEVLSKYLPKLEDPKYILLTDRSIYTTMVYQQPVEILGTNLATALLNRSVNNTWPCMIHFEANIDRTHAMRDSGDQLENISRSDVEKRKLSFERVKEYATDHRFGAVTINAEQSIEDVTDEIVAKIRPLLSQLRAPN